MHATFVIRGESEEPKIKKILAPILKGINRTTHKVTYRTNMGLVEYICIPPAAGQGNKAPASSDILRKVSLWNRDSTDALEKMLRSKGVDLGKSTETGSKRSKKS